MFERRVVLPGPTYSATQKIEAVRARDRGVVYTPQGLHRLNPADQEVFFRDAKLVQTRYAKAGAGATVLGVWGQDAGRDTSRLMPYNQQRANMRRMSQIGAQVAHDNGKLPIATVAPLTDSYGAKDMNLVGEQSVSRALEVRSHFFQDVASAEVNIGMAETFRDLDELAVTMALGKRFGVHIIAASFFCQNEDGVLRLPNGPTLEEAAQACATEKRFKGLEMVGTNCANPKIALQATEELVRTVGYKFAIGEWENSRAEPSGDPLEERTLEEYAEFLEITRTCEDAGALAVGGCCGTDVWDVANIANNSLVVHQPALIASFA